MLKQLRSKTVTKFVLWAILLLILPAFVLFGTERLTRGDKNVPKFVGMIENKKVSFSDFSQSLTSIRCQILLKYFDNQNALQTLLKNNSFLAKLAWDRLIMVKKARMARIKVSDKEVVNYIRSHPLFIRNDRFDDRMYQYFLKNSLGMYPRDFEEHIRENLMIQKLTDSVTKNIKVNDEEAAREYNRDNAKFKISYALVPVASFTDKVVVKEEDVKDFYEKHKDEFMLQTKDAETKEESRKVAGLDEMKPMIKTALTEKGAMPLALESAKNARDKIIDLMAKDKLTFEAAAAKAGLKAQESQVFAKSDYLEGIGEADTVADKAFSMKQNEVSEPIETRKGVLIFRVTDVQLPDKEKFAKDKENYSKKVLVEKKNIYTEEWLKNLEKTATINIDLNNIERYYK